MTDLLKFEDRLTELEERNIGYKQDIVLLTQENSQMFERITALEYSMEHEVAWANEPAEPDEGVKFDSDKLPYHLIAPEFLQAVAEILAFGESKYGARNWEKGMAWHRPYRACLGHLFDWWSGKNLDDETGKSHLWHAACCVMFLVTYEERNTGKDDRP